MKEGVKNPNLFESVSEQLIRKSQAMTLLGFSRHTFEKAKKNGDFRYSVVVSDKGKEIEMYSLQELCPDVPYETTFQRSPVLFLNVLQSIL